MDSTTTFASVSNLEEKSSISFKNWTSLNGENFDQWKSQNKQLFENSETTKEQPTTTTTTTTTTNAQTSNSREDELARKYIQIWKRNARAKKLHQQHHTSQTSKLDWLLACLLTPKSETVRKLAESIVEKLSSVSEARLYVFLDWLANALPAVVGNNESCSNFFDVFASSLAKSGGMCFVFVFYVCCL